MRPAADELQKLPLRLRRTRAARALAATLAGPARSTAAAAMLRLPEWMAELCGGLSRPLRSELQRIQLLLLCAILWRDALDDAPASDPSVRAHDVRELHGAARRRLALLFPARSPFWRGYENLNREQRRASRWERSRIGLSHQLDAALLRSLGRKAALLRWPALAAAELAKRPRAARRMDRVVERMLIVYQLLDDLLDADEDALRGQPNAVVAATPKRGNERAARAVAVARVSKAAGRELSAVLEAVPASCALARHARVLLRRCAVSQRDAALRARAELVLSALAQLEG